MWRWFTPATLNSNDIARNNIIERRMFETPYVDH